MEGVKNKSKKVAVYDPGQLIATTHNSSLKLLKRLIIALGLSSVFITLSTFWAIDRVIIDLPKAASLSGYKPSLASEVFAGDGQKIGEFFKEKRYFVKYEKIPKAVIHAFIASEDQNFFEHPGVDLKSIARALIVDIFNLQLKQGGSTITQQLARAYFLSNAKTIQRKAREVFLAYQVEKQFSKKQILEMYLNMVFLGDGSYGVAAAAQNYFEKDLQDLTLPEIAMLAGLPQAPSKYNPRINLTAAIKRQNYVLSRMRASGYIDSHAFEKATRFPIKLANRTTFNFKYAPFYLDHVKSEVLKYVDEETVLTGGLRIETTLDLDLQIAANKIVTAQVSKLRKKHINKAMFYRQKHDVNKLEGALLSIDPHTGYIKAMVGGTEYKESQYNRTTQSRRQPGSSLKPLYFALAIEKGFHPASLFSGQPMTYDDWTPKNFSQVYYDNLTMYYALIRSLNTVSVQIFDAVGITRVIKLLREIGVESPIKKEMGLSLGSSGMTMLELTKAYSMFPNKGTPVTPVAVTAIYDRNNKLLYALESDKAKAKPKQLLQKQTAYIMTSMLEHVIKHGTGIATRWISKYIGGKTGTTNEGRDTWFIGFSQDLLTSVWVGHDDFLSLGNGATGSRYALPIWREYMRDAIKKYVPKPFVAPPGIVFHMINSISGMPSDSGVLLPFYRGSYVPSASFYYNNWYGQDSKKGDVKKGVY